MFNVVAPSVWARLSGHVGHVGDSRSRDKFTYMDLETCRSLPKAAARNGCGSRNSDEMRSRKSVIARELVQRRRASPRCGLTATMRGDATDVAM